MADYAKYVMSKNYLGMCSAALSTVKINVEAACCLSFKLLQTIMYVLVLAAKIVLAFLSSLEFRRHQAHRQHGVIICTPRQES